MKTTTCPKCITAERPLTEAEELAIMALPAGGYTKTLCERHGRRLRNLKAAIQQAERDEREAASDQ